MASLRESQKERPRQLLLSAALELFQAKGYAATTVDDIAAAAGTTRVTFYAYFPARSDLVRALVDEVNEALERSGSPPHDSTGRALVAVVSQGSPEKLGEWLLTTSSRWDVIRPHLNAASEAAAIDPESRDLVNRGLEEAITHIGEGLHQAALPPESRRLRGVLARAQLDHVARHWRPGPGNIDRDHVVGVLAASWTNLLTGEGTPSG